MKQVLFFLLLAASCFGQSFTFNDPAFICHTNTYTWAPTNAYGWWRADSLLPTVNGTSVLVWPDSSGSHNFNVVSNYTPYAPYFTNNIINSLPGIVWATGTASIGLTNAFGATLAQPLTMFLVMQSRDVAGASVTWFDSISASPRIIVAKNSGTLAPILNAGTSQTATGAYAQSAWYVWTFYFNQAASYIRTNGVDYFTVPATIGTSGSTGITIGTRYENATSSMKSTVSELILYNGTMADADRNWVEANLKTKYGL